MERVAIGPGAKAVANARGAAGVRAGKRRCRRDERCHEYRIDHPSGDTVFLRRRRLTPGRDRKDIMSGSFMPNQGGCTLCGASRCWPTAGVETARSPPTLRSYRCSSIEAHVGRCWVLARGAKKRSENARIWAWCHVHETNSFSNHDLRPLDPCFHCLDGWERWPYRMGADSPIGRQRCAPRLCLVLARTPGARRYFTTTISSTRKIRPLAAERRWGGQGRPRSDLDCQKRLLVVETRNINNRAV